MSIEERFRIAAETTADTVRHIRPVPLPGDELSTRPARFDSSRRRAWSGWLIPLTAAAAVLAIAATLVAVRSTPGQESPSQPVAAGAKSVTSSRATPTVSASVPSNVLTIADVPQYYVTLNDEAHSSREAVLRSTATGAALETFPSPPYGDWSVVNSDGGDTFVLSRPDPAPTKPGYAADVVETTGFWTLQVNPGDPQQSTLTKIPITTSFAYTNIDSTALSPDGRTLAIAYQHVNHTATGGLTGPVILQTFSVATGKLLHTWTGYDIEPLNMTWLGDDHTLAWSALSTTAGATFDTLNVSGTGTDLNSAIRVFSVGQAAAGSATSGQEVIDSLNSCILTLDGKSVICGSDYIPCPKGETGCSRGKMQLTAYSAATGKQESVLYRYPGTGYQFGQVTPLWAASTSTVVAEVQVQGPASSKGPGANKVSLGVATSSGFTQVPFQAATLTGFDGLHF